jgi:NifU-like protein involved in Fe-S cluster formation
MSDLDDIYSAKILELAAHIPCTARLPAPDATASARSKLCGSEIEIDLAMTSGVVSGYGQTVKACLLGQATASIVGREIVGTGPAELRAVATSLRAMLKENGPPPNGRWSDLLVLQPVRDYKHRHDAVLLVFDAVEKALSAIEAKVAAA